MRATVSSFTRTLTTRSCGEIEKESTCQNQNNEKKIRKQAKEGMDPAGEGEKKESD